MTDDPVAADTLQALHGRRWIRSEEFGPYLLKARKEGRLSLRLAAAGIGISHSHLAKLERGQFTRALDPALLQRIADTYRLPFQEVLQKAGYRERDQSEGVREDIDRAFANLFLHPPLRPAKLDQAALSYFSLLAKKQLLEFAQRLERYLDLEDAFSVEELQLDEALRVARRSLSPDGEASAPNEPPDPQEDPQP